MNLADFKVNDFIRSLGSQSPAPGGGAAAALAASLGVALCKMVANLTVGREKYSENEYLIRDILTETEILSDRAVSLIDKDNNAYSKVSQAYKLPKETETEVRARKETIQEALKGATVVPFETIELCYDTVILTKMAVGKSNSNAASDLACSARMLKAAAEAGFLNVLINLSYINDDDFVSEYRRKAENLISKVVEISDEVYEQVKNGI